jgi:4-hydroxy-3-methylbut-2-en-1-yl diphosphate reductase
VFIVVGSKASSNANRLREVAERLGAKSYLIDDAEGLDANWVPSNLRVAVTAGASTPEHLVKQVLQRLDELGHGNVVLAGGESESVEFRLPSALIDA